jgi:hypothetical protein
MGLTDGEPVEEGNMSQWIRVSCAALCRIEHLGKFLLLLNVNRRQKGIYRLGPIGGALQVFDRARMQAFSAVPEDPTESDLRLTMPHAALPAFREWFYTGDGRERSPFRELREELVGESKLLAALRPEDMDARYLWTVEEESLTDRRGQTGLLTHYFLEIYDIKFKTSATLGPLLSAAPDSGAIWLTAEQIERESSIQLDVDGALRDVRIRGKLLVQPPSPP